jgi:hypothetical protein
MAHETKDNLRKGLTIVLLSKDHMILTTEIKNSKPLRMNEMRRDTIILNDDFC